MLITAVTLWGLAACGAEGDKPVDETPGGKAMEQYMSVNFLSGQLPAGTRLSKEKFITTISVVDNAMKAKKPALVFFTVAPNGNAKDVVNKKGSKDTDKVMAEVFSGKQASWKVGLLAKFILSATIDITKVTAKDNDYFNPEKGPAVLVAGPDGKQVALIEAEKMEPDDVARALTRALDKSDIDTGAILARLNKELKALTAAEAGAARLEKEQLAMLGQIANTKDPNAKAALEKQRQTKAAEVVKLKAETERLQKKIEEVPVKPAK
jgi:hypothetical protein